MIASAIALKPKLLIADEPTPPLDVTLQTKVLELLKEIQAESSIILITHDLLVVERVADRVVVMQAGRIVESGTSRDVMRNPQHEYTRRLPATIPGRAGFSATVPRSAPFLEVQGVSKIYGDLARQVARLKTQPARAVDDASFAVSKGDTLGVVGESGLGKIDPRTHDPRSG